MSLPSEKLTEAFYVLRLSFFNANTKNEFEASLLVFNRDVAELVKDISSDILLISKGER